MVKEEVKDEVKDEVKEDSTGTFKIFLKGVTGDLTKSTLSTFFAKHGKVADVIFKFAGGRRKDMAYIQFESEEPVKKWLEEKTVTIDDKEVEIKEVTRKSFNPKDPDDMLDVPKEALKCFVCKREKFSSVPSYMMHTKGKAHQAVYKIFRAKSSAVYQLLKSESKLAADRSYDAIWVKKNPKAGAYCDVCQCNLLCKPEKHEHTVEHKMVKNYSNPKCCDITFTNRNQYESHMLTLRHLKTVYEKEQKKKVDVDDDGRPSMKKAIDLYKQCDADLKELKETYGELDLNAELPAFDPKNPIGLNYIVKKINYHCICCDQKFFAHLNLVEPHCRSYNHYTNMTDYIVGVDKRIAQKRETEETEFKPNKKKALDTDGNVKKGAAKDKETEDSRLNKSATEKGGDIKRRGKKASHDDDEDEEEEEMDTLDKSIDEGDVEEEQEEGDEEQEEGDEEQEEGDEEQEEGDEEQEEGDEEQEEGDEEQEVEEQDEADEGGEVEEEAAEDKEEAEDSGQEDKEEEEDEPMQTEEPQAKPRVTPKKITKITVEDTPEEKEESDEEEEQEQPKPTRGSPRGRRARGRGRGRGLKR